MSTNTFFIEDMDLSSNTVHTHLEIGLNDAMPAGSHVIIDLDQTEWHEHRTMYTAFVLTKNWSRPYYTVGFAVNKLFEYLYIPPVLDSIPQFKDAEKIDTGKTQYVIASRRIIPENTNTYALHIDDQFFLFTDDHYFIGGFGKPDRPLDMLKSILEEKILFLLKLKL